MGSLADRVGPEEKSSGGQPHHLPLILARLDAETAADLRAALASPLTNFPELARIMRDEYGCRESYSTWSRWAKDWRNGRTF